MSTEITEMTELAFEGSKIVINDNRVGELSQKLYDTISAIQAGTAPDPRGWRHAV